MWPRAQLRPTARQATTIMSACCHRRASSATWRGQYQNAQNWIIGVRLPAPATHVSAAPSRQRGYCFPTRRQPSPSPSPSPSRPAPSSSPHTSGIENVSSSRSRAPCPKGLPHASCVPSSARPERGCRPAGLTGHLTSLDNGPGVADCRLKSDHVGCRNGSPWSDATDTQDRNGRGSSAGSGLWLTAQYRAERGYDPTRRALTSMRQHAAQLTRKGKPEGALDYAQALRGWERVSRTAELGTLRTLARQIWHRAGDAPEPGPLTAEQARAAMAAALAARARSRPVGGFS